MANIKSILRGWKNFISKSEVTEQLAKERAVICSDCLSLSKSLITAFINDHIKEIQGYKCGICECPLSAKVRSKEENCPLNKW